MTVLLWDQSGDRLYETGVDKAVLYIPTAGVYDLGVPWNGITGVTESPSGAEPNAQYADNIKYLNLLSREEFAGTIEAFTYPDEFGTCDGSVESTPGMYISQQPRSTFGLCYRTKLGNDVDGEEHGYKLHMIYGALAAPSEKAYATINDTPEAIGFSWAFSTTPVTLVGASPTALVVVDSTQVGADELAALEDELYGTAGSDARLPLPDEIYTILSAGAPVEAVTVTPTFVPATGVITIPSVTGVTYRRADTNAVVAAGTVTIGVAGASLIIRAFAASGYVLSDESDTSWTFKRDA
jgi:hypothetical protein